MKLALPENAKIAKEAKECMQECVSEFISFITSEGECVLFANSYLMETNPSEASEKCQQEKRKTVNGEDILFAMTSLGFENYAEALKIYLSKYREVRPVQRLWTILSIPDGLCTRASVAKKYQTQSARGEHQNRPPSSGYAGGGPVGGAASGPSVVRAGGAAAGGAFPEASDNAGGIMNQGLDPSEQDTSAYGYPPMVGQGHNGAGGESY